MRSRLAIPLLCLAAVPAVAQDEPSPSAAAAYFALDFTPVGALPWTITSRTAATDRGTAFRAQFGYQDMEGDVSRRTFGAGVDMMAGPVMLGVTAGIGDLACEDIDDPFFAVELDCGKGIMGGVSLGRSLVTSTVGAQATRFDLGIEGTLGYVSADDFLTIRDPSAGDEIRLSGDGLSVTLGAPLVLAARSGGWAVVPHIVPRFGWGRSTQEFTSSADPSQNEKQTESGTRFLLGGGIALLAEQSGFGVTVGFQKVFIEDGESTIGVGVSWGR